MAGAEVRAKATSMADGYKQRGDPRPHAEIVRSCTKGLSMERVVAEWLTLLGFTVTYGPANEWWYDMIVNGIKVDVKSNWKRINSYSQTDKERPKLLSNKQRVVYLCFEVDEAADSYIVFDGAAESSAMRDNLSGNGTGFVMIKDLKDFKV